MISVIRSDSPISFVRLVSAKTPAPFARPVRILKRISPRMKMTPRQRARAACHGWITPRVLYDAPLRLRYTDLDPTAQYRVRVVYAGDNPRRKIRLLANDSAEVHPLLSKPMPFRPLEFDIPKAATASGVLTLSWQGEPGLGGNGRNCQVSEVWLEKGDAVVRQRTPALTIAGV